MKRGLTLIELLVVIATLGLLLALALPAIQSAREAAREAECKSNLHEIAIEIDSRIKPNGKIPVVLTATAPYKLACPTGLAVLGEYEKHYAQYQQSNYGSTRPYYVEQLQKPLAEITLVLDWMPVHGGYLTPSSFRFAAFMDGHVERFIPPPAVVPNPDDEDDSEEE